MAIDVKSVTKAALNVLFGLGGDLIKDGTYYRPPSYNPGSGTVVTSEVAAACKILVASIPQRQFAELVVNLNRESVLIRASELVAIDSPAEGDYIVQADGTRRDVIAVPRLDTSGEFWTFQTQRTLFEDWGDLTAHSAAEDWGDLTTATSFEDRGPLF
jgi:hypothetical protein